MISIVEEKTGVDYVNVVVLVMFVAVTTEAYERHMEMNLPRDNKRERVSKRER